MLQVCVAGSGSATGADLLSRRSSYPYFIIYFLILSLLGWLVVLQRLWYVNEKALGGRDYRGHSHSSCQQELSESFLPRVVKHAWEGVDGGSPWVWCRQVD